MMFRSQDAGTRMPSSRAARWGILALTSGLLAASSTAFCASADQRVLSDFQPCPARYQLPEPIADKAQCATLTVPENRAAPAARTLVLPILRLRASDPNPGAPVFVLNGGPGQPNLDRVLPLVRIGQARDVVYVGYRGAEGSTVLQCAEVNAQLDAPEIFAAASLERIAAAGGACARRLERSGIDLARYTMLDVIDDLEAARGALGYDTINLFSSSYGTRVAQYYARRHPQRIARSVMLGVNPPGHFVFSARMNDEILSRLSQLCAADGWCSTKTKDLRHSVLHALQLSGQHGNAHVDAGKTHLALFYSMYRRDAFRSFAEAAIAAEHGDWSGLAGLGRMSRDGVKTMVWGDLLSKGILDTYRYAELEATFSTTAESMGSPFDLLYQSIGRHWPRFPFPEEYHRAVPDPTPTLLINGDLDVATPLAFAESELLPHLPNGKLLVLKDYGHGDIVRQGPALDQIVATYLATGQLDASLLKDDPYVFRQ